MTRLTTWLLGLLRRLLSSPFVSGSIKRLLLWVHIIQRRFSRTRPPVYHKDSPNVFIPSPSQTSRVAGFPVVDIICPSLQPPSREADSKSLHVSHPVHSPEPRRGYILPYVHEPQGSQSSQDITTLTQREHISISSHPDSLSSLHLSLPRPSSRISRRPNSRASQPIKVSRAPTPESPPARGVPPQRSSPPPLRTVAPMSTASVRRWDRNIIVYVLPICT